MRRLSRRRRGRRTAGGSQGPSDAGVAGILVLALASVLALVGALSTSLAAVAVARQRAAAVADLAALAAAARVLEGPAAACGRAADLAQRNGGSLTWCRVDGDRVDVLAEVRPAGVLGGLGAASARARAGPDQGRGQVEAEPDRGRVQVGAGQTGAEARSEGGQKRARAGPKQG